MQVLMTTSPPAWVACPPCSPNTVNPSSSTRTIGSGMLHQALRHHLAATDGHDHPSAQPPAGKGRVLAAAPEGRCVHRPFGIRIDQDPFVIQRLADDLSRPRHTCAVDSPIGEAQPQDNTHRGLETVEALRPGLLRGLVMGGM